MRAVLVHRETSVYGNNLQVCSLTPQLVFDNGARKTCKSCLTENGTCARRLTLATEWHERRHGQTLSPPILPDPAGDFLNQDPRVIPQLLADEGDHRFPDLVNQVFGLRIGSGGFYDHLPPPRTGWAGTAGPLVLAVCEEGLCQPHALRVRVVSGVCREAVQLGTADSTRSAGPTIARQLRLRPGATAAPPVADAFLPTPDPEVVAPDALGSKTANGIQLGRWSSRVDRITVNRSHAWCGLFFSHARSATGQIVVGRQNRELCGYWRC